MKDGDKIRIKKLSNEEKIEKESLKIK